MPVNEEIRSLVLSHAPSNEIRVLAAKQGMSSLREDGKRLVLEGRTTLEEVLRMTKVEVSGNSPVSSVQSPVSEMPNSRTGTEKNQD